MTNWLHETELTDLDWRRRLVAAQFAVKGESPPVLRAIPEEAGDVHS